MPVVPTVDSFRATPTAAPGTNFRLLDMGDAGAQAKEMGQALGHASNAIAEIIIDKRQDEIKNAAKDADTSLTAGLNDLLHNPETGYLSQQGKNAVDGYKPTVDAIDKLRNSILDQMKDRQARELAAPLFMDRAQSAITTIQSHASRQNHAYKIQTSEARAEVSLNDAASNYRDGDYFNRSLGTALQEVDDQARLQGWDESTAKLQRDAYIDKAFKRRYNAWKGDNSAEALADFQKNKGAISPLARDQIGSELFSAAAPQLAQMLNSFGGVDQVVTGPKAPPNKPRGIRNNNPGNVQRGGDKWQGEIGGKDPRYSTFSTPEAGIRAMGKTLLTYQDKHGLRSVEDIISRWAPATENDTQSYIASVAKSMGLRPGASLDLRDQSTLSKLVAAMIKVENGEQPYTDAQISTGIAAALGTGKLPDAVAQAVAQVDWRDPDARTGIAVIDNLPPDQRIRVMQLAQTQQHQEMSRLRESLAVRVQDSTAEYIASGMATNPPTQYEFIRAYGQADGMRRYQELQNHANYGQKLQEVKFLPTSSLNDLLKTEKPAMGEGFASRQRDYELLTHAVDTVIKARTEDPVAFAITAGSYGIKPINRLDDPNTLRQELSRRASAAPQMAKDYGTPPSLFTISEGKALGAMLAAMPVESQKNHLATINAGVNNMDLFKRTMQALAPDSPTIAVAGIYQARGLRTTENRDVSDLILRGQAILTPNKKEDGSGHLGGQSLVKMPEANLLLSEWISETGDAFKGKEQAADLFMQTAKAIYAARSAEDGDYSGVLNSKRWSAAIALATGGIGTHNGSQIVMPYGMGYDKFQDLLREQASRLVQNNGVMNASVQEITRLPLVNVGDGRYLVRRGTGYLVNKNGQPVVIDMSGGRR